MTPDPRAVEAMRVAMMAADDLDPGVFYPLSLDDDAFLPAAAAILAALPEGWPLTPEQQAALADGEALARLREALPEGHNASVLIAGVGGFDRLAAPMVAYMWVPDDPLAAMTFDGPTIAAAADAAREALDG